MLGAFPPSDHDRVLKYNPITNNISLIDCSYGFEEDKWMSSVLSSDGYIYCIPVDALDTLIIDSRNFNEQVLELIENICKHNVEPSSCGR